MKKILTLCLVYKEPYLLLGMKKRGFGAGRWNGFGGKIKEGESVGEAAKRETREEVGIVPRNLEKAGILNFTFEGEDELLETHLFRIDDFDGEPLETEEMRPQWFHKDKIPFEEMWPDDRYWLPLFLAGENIEGDFHFIDMNTLAHHTLKQI